MGKNVIVDEIVAGDSTLTLVVTAQYVPCHLV